MKKVTRKAQREKLKECINLRARLLDAMADLDELLGVELPMDEIDNFAGVCDSADEFSDQYLNQAIREWLADARHK